MPRDPIRPTADGAPDPGSRRVRLSIAGIVQGVGFRPFVYRLAGELGLSGFVRNDERGVTVEVQGPAAAVDGFRQRLPLEIPPLASIESLDLVELAPEASAGFRIAPSDRADRPSALVTPDAATCDACLRELFDPDDRRYRYAFTNCTHCGPRFTIVRGIPYDRPYTTMAGFEMCGACRAEYDDPADRRFHAQPNACPDCGPSVRLLDTAGRAMAEAGGAGGSEPIVGAARALIDGSIVAVKGLGGFHLACVADDETAVARLRARKRRYEKPFAVMVPDLEDARRLVSLDDVESALLAGRERPIVLARRLPDARVAEAVAPGHRDLGLMLPYTPLHHILLAEVGRPLVMTSGNLSDEPIAYRDEDALERLATIADLFLVHDRPIETRTDDSVVRAVTVAGVRRPLMLRRSRGYVPVPERLRGPGPPPAEASSAPEPARGTEILACGAHLKNTFAVARGDRVWISHHIGDLENLETLTSFEEGAAHFEALFEVRPGRIAHDLHPDYLSTRYATRRIREAGLEGVAIQHHHAHLAACLAEHDEAGPAIGVVYDGSGYGPDGTVWGGEILIGDAGGFERAAHLGPVRLPGGEAAIHEPWRMACAWLTESATGPDGRDSHPSATESDSRAPSRAAPAIPAWWPPGVVEDRWAIISRLARTGPASPFTSSVGRLFDAVSSLCGVRLEVSYEGQAAIELELAAARAGETGGSAGGVATAAGYPLPFDDPGEGPLRLDARPTIRAVYEDLAAGEPVPVVARRFHEGVASGTVAVCVELAGRTGLDAVALSGGVFQNVLLLERVAAGLDAAGLRPLVPSRLPPNDGGISYGQAVIAAARRDGAAPTP